MLQTSRIVLMLLLIALVPVRAIATVTLDSCKAGEQHSGQHQHHTAPEAPQDDGNGGHDDAAGGAAHCGGAAFGVSGEPASLALDGVTERTSFGVRIAPGFCPDLIDRPPLVS